MSYTHRKNSIKIILDRNSFFKVIIKTLNDRKIRLIYKSDFKIFASHKDWRVLRKRTCHLCLSSPYKYPLHRVLESYEVILYYKPFTCLSRHAKSTGLALHYF